MRLKNLLAAAAIGLFALGGQAHAANIVETAASAGQFKTLLKAASKAGLVDALSGGGPLTVFAPTDEAFAALPRGTVRKLLRPRNKDKLAAILSYHVVGGNVTSGDLPHGTIQVTPLNDDQQLSLTRSAGGVTVNDANVVAADIAADNGTIHVIDKVLIPGS